MPVRAENRDRYPDNWKEISHRVRFERARGRCECTGQCGVDHAAESFKYPPPEYHSPWTVGPRCNGEHGLQHPITGSAVVLTTMHLDHNETNCEDSNLLAACQRCHNRYDYAHRAAGIRERRRQAQEAAGQTTLFGG